MSKLFKLKEWLTIADTAKYLSNSLDEEVAEADVLRLGLDRKLTLSVYFVNHTQARKGKIVSWLDTDWFLSKAVIKDSPIISSPKSDIPTVTAPTKLVELLSKLEMHERGNVLPILRNEKIDEDRYIELSDNVESISDIWDLMMVGGEALDIEHKYQMLIKGTEVSLECLAGAFVERDGIVCQLMDTFDKDNFKSTFVDAVEDLSSNLSGINEGSLHEDELRVERREQFQKFAAKMKRSKSDSNYYPAAGLPDDSILVVRTSAISALLDSLSSKTERPLLTKERNSLLTLIAALCVEAKIDPAKRGVAVALAKSTEILGSPLAEDTVLKILKQVKDRA